MKNGLLSLPQYAAHFLRDPLHRNSFFLMASTGYMAVIGFLFWIIASHFYTPEAVGLAGSLISISGLLISLGTLGFPATLIRFLKTSTKQQQKINTSFTLASITALGLAAAFWVVSQFVVPELHALIASPVFFIFFALALLAAVWSQIFGAIFVAYREAHWVLLESLIFSTNKVIFIFFAISLGAMGLFLSNFGTLIIAVMIDVMILFFW
jgi:O-antigen/teichoic acid export membrane protein